VGWECCLLPTPSLTRFALPTSYSIANQPPLKARSFLVIATTPAVIETLDPQLPHPAFSTNTPNANTPQKSQNNYSSRSISNRPKPLDLTKYLMPVFPCCRRCRRCRRELGEKHVITAAIALGSHPSSAEFSSTSPGRGAGSGRTRIGRSYRHFFVRAIRDI